MTISTTHYETLDRARLLLRFLAPVVGLSLTLLGLTLFADVVPELLSSGNSISERLIWGVKALGYVMVLPMSGYVLFFMLRALADFIELWIQGTIAAEKTAHLIERQLVPAVLRMCQLLEQMPRVPGQTEAPGSAAPPQADRSH